MSKARSAGSDTIGGSDAFLLYVPTVSRIDLTELIASEGGMKVDTDAFAVELQRQKERSRNAPAVDTDDWVELLPIAEEPVRRLRYARKRPCAFRAIAA